MKLNIAFAEPSKLQAIRIKRVSLLSMRQLWLRHSIGLIGLAQRVDGLGWIGSHKMNPWTTLSSGLSHARAARSLLTRWQMTDRRRWSGALPLVATSANQYISTNVFINPYLTITSSGGRCRRREKRHVRSTGHAKAAVGNCIVVSPFVGSSSTAPDVWLINGCASTQPGGFSVQSLVEQCAI